MPNSTSGSLRLYLVRHAHAAWGEPGMRDFDRPLDPAGIRQAQRLAEQAVASGLAPQHIVSSPARRCRQTAETLAAAFPGIAHREEPLLYSSGADAYLTSIRGHAETGLHPGALMIVGHNPMIEAVALHLAGETGITAPLAAGYPTAGLVAIDLTLPLPASLAGCGRAAAFIAPPLN